jgi:SAM-dependent methyltransferase
MSAFFYRALEERHRGSRQLIKSRLQVYLPFVEPLSAIDPLSQTIDLGCGRGEWLEVLKEAGFEPKGVDLDAGMLQACQEIGLDVKLGDAFDYLIALADESQMIVTAFHFVEHVSFEQLQKLVHESLRVLKPGGLLILETPNPENIVVATRNFYLDPTHQKPIPPDLLSFVVEHTGFAVVKTLRLQESKELAYKTHVTMHDVITGASPDYAVVAQKKGPKKILNLLANAFSQEYGLSLEHLLKRWDTRFNSSEAIAEQAHAEAQQAHAEAQQAHAEAQQAHAEAQQAHAEAQQAHAEAQQAQTIAQQAHAEAQQAHAEAQQAISKLEAIYVSRSWRLTLPLRWLGHQSFLLRKRGLKGRIKDFIKKCLRHIIGFVDAHPRLKRLSVLLIYKLGFQDTLMRIKNVFTSNTGVQTKQDVVGIMHPHHVSRQVRLSPRAMAIYADLKVASRLP